MFGATSRAKVHSLQRIAPVAVVVAVVAIAVLMLLAPVSGQLVAQPSSSGPSSVITSVSSSTPHVTGTIVVNHQESLTLGKPGLLNVFAMANGGNFPSTGFSSGNPVIATDHLGYPTAALAVTTEGSNSFTTSDQYYRIGGVGVSGFQYFGELTKMLIPPVRADSMVTVKVALPESALVVVVGLSGGQNNVIALGGVPGLVIDAKGYNGNWTAVMIGQAQLSATTYNVTLTETHVGTNGEVSRGELLGIFAFSNSRAGFIDKNLMTPKVVVTIPTGGGGASNLAYDSGKAEVFEGFEWAPNVYVISDATNSVVANISVGSSPMGMAYDRATGEVFVADFGGSNVSVINDTNNSVVASIAVGFHPWDVAYDSGKGELFVTDGGPNGGNAVSVISDANNSVVATIWVPSGPTGTTYDSAKGEVYVASFPSDSVSVINDTTNTVVATDTLPSWVTDVSYDRATGQILATTVVQPGDGEAYVISDATNSVVATIQIGAYGWYGTFDSATGAWFVANGNSGNISVISDATDSVVASISIGAGPFGIVYDSGTAEVFYGLPGLVGVISY
jgi:YVTN family beta-propeller protein